MLAGWREKLTERYQQWVNWRLPAASKIRLNSNRLFIFPTRSGFSFIAVLILLWLTATNYENNLVFGAAFLLSAMFVVAIFHTFLNLSGLSVEAGRTYPCYCGGRAEFGLALHQTGRRYRDNIKLHYRGSEELTTSLPGIELAEVTLAVAARTRGWLEPGRVTVESVYPLGLLRVWTHLELNMRALVYPQPMDAKSRTATPVAGQGVNEMPGGREDFRGLEKYRPGESLSHIAWKHYAREQGLQTKHYSDPVDEQVWLDWDAFPGMDTEARLSRLCGWLLDLSKGSAVYGLRLPGIEVMPGRGEVHRDNILKELALFERTGWATD